MVLVVAWVAVAAHPANAAPSTTVPASTTSTTSNVIVAGKSRFRLPVDLGGLHLVTTAVTAPLRAGGPLDIITANSDGTVAVIVNHGDGTFDKPVSYVASKQYPVGDVTTADVNGDGRLDVVATLTDPAANNGAIAAFLGKGDGTLRPVVTSSTVTPPGGGQQDVPRQIAAGHFLSGSKGVDVAIGFSPGGANAAVVRIFPGLGNGHFGPPAQVIGVGSTYASVTALSTVRLGHSGKGGDGLIVDDTACGFDGGLFLVLTPTKAGLAETFRGPGCPANIAVADLNGDGNLDLLTTVGHVLQTPRTAAAFYGKGDGRFGPLTAIELGAAPVAVTAGDFNGDGRVDIAGVDGGAVQLATGLGNGRFGPPVALPIGGGSRMLAVDLNGDGAQDLVLVSGSITLVLNATPVPKGTLSTIASSLATPRQAFRTVKHVAIGGGLTLAALFLITFPADIFDQTFEANYDTISGWWRKRIAWLSRFRRVQATEPAESAVSANDALRKPSSASDRLAFAAVFVGGALLGGMLDPHFGFSRSSAETLTAVLLATAFGLVRAGVVTAAYHQVRSASARGTCTRCPSGCSSPPSAW
jgi:hypothetical protein